MYYPARRPGFLHDGVASGQIADTQRHFGWEKCVEFWLRASISAPDLHFGSFSPRTRMVFCTRPNTEQCAKCIFHHHRPGDGNERSTNETVLWPTRSWTLCSPMVTKLCSPPVGTCLSGPLPGRSRPLQRPWVAPPGSTFKWKIARWKVSPNKTFLQFTTSAFVEILVSCGWNLSFSANTSNFTLLHHQASLTLLLLHQASLTLLLRH